MLPLDAKALFNMELEDFRSEASFETNVVMYRSFIALALNENEDNPPIARVNASRAADRLLSVDGVMLSTGVTGLLRSVVFSLVVVWIAGWLMKVNVRLKI